LLSQWTTIGLPYVTFVVALLMVSRVRYPHFAKQILKGRRSFQHLVKVTFAIVAVFAIHELAIPMIFAYYVVSAPMVAVWERLTGVRPAGLEAAPTATVEQPSARDDESRRTAG
jgi:CDP-diacylglycerol--serine O-phosphatidyltransferase